MGQGGYIFCEWDSVQKSYPDFKMAFRALDDKIMQKCIADWKPRNFGYLVPTSDEFGRTTILPALFDNWAGVQMAYWRQLYTGVGGAVTNFISGCGTGNIIPEDFKVAWIGLAFPNKQQHITEIKFQIGDRKYGRLNLEEMLSFNKPAVIFEEGFIINEEQSFDIQAYIEGPIPADWFDATSPRLYQSMVMLGAAYYKQIDKVLGDCGAAL